MKVRPAARPNTQIAPDLPLLSRAGGRLKHMRNIKNKSRSHQPGTKVVILLSACFFSCPESCAPAMSGIANVLSRREPGRQHFNAVDSVLEGQQWSHINYPEHVLLQLHFCVCKHLSLAVGLRLRLRRARTFSTPLCPMLRAQSAKMSREIFVKDTNKIKTKCFLL